MKKHLKYSKLYQTAFFACTFLCVSFFVCALFVACKGTNLNVAFSDLQLNTAVYGTVYRLPEVTAKSGETVKAALATVRAADGDTVVLSENSFYVSSFDGYIVSFSAAFNGRIYESDEYKIKTEINAEPQITLPKCNAYSVKIGETFRIPIQNISAYDPYDASYGKTPQITYSVEKNGVVFEVDGEEFIVEEAGEYRVIVTAKNSRGEESCRSFTVTGDARYKNCFANFEGAYAESDLALFSTESRAAARTPGVLNTDVKYTHNSSGGSLKLSATGVASYTSFIFSPDLDFSVAESDTLTFTFWAYIDKIPSDVNLDFLRLKVYGEKQLKDGNGNDKGEDVYGFKDMNIYGLGSLSGKGSKWLPCSFDIKKGQNGPFVAEFFYRGENDGGKIDFDVYLDDFAVAPSAKTVTSAYKINLSANETAGTFNPEILAVSEEKIITESGFEVHIFDSSENLISRNAGTELSVKKDDYLVAKYFKDGIQAVENTKIYAVESEKNTAVLKWDDASVENIGECVRLYDFKGAESVFKISKSKGKNKKPSLTFKNDGALFVYPLTVLRFSVYVSDTMWVPVGEDGTLQSCPLAFSGCSSVYGKGLPVAKAYRRGRTENIMKSYASGIPYLNTRDLKGEWIDVHIDFLSADECSAEGISLWFNNYHNPVHAVEDDPEDTDSSLYFTDISQTYDNAAPEAELQKTLFLAGEKISTELLNVSDPTNSVEELKISAALYFNGEKITAEVSGGAYVFTPKSAGEYILKVVVADRWGNFTAKRFRIAVTDERLPESWTDFYK